MLACTALCRVPRRAVLRLQADLATPYDRAKSHPEALVQTQYAMSPAMAFGVVLRRQLLLIIKDPVLLRGRLIQVGAVGWWGEVKKGDRRREGPHTAVRTHHGVCVGRRAGGSGQGGGEGQGQGGTEWGKGDGGEGRGGVGVRGKGSEKGGRGGQGGGEGGHVWGGRSVSLSQ